jgi:hypothetical protein
MEKIKKLIIEVIIWLLFFMFLIFIFKILNQ